MTRVRVRVRGRVHLPAIRPVKRGLCGDTRPRDPC